MGGDHVSIDPTALTNIQAASLEGRVAVCEYLKVIWNGSTTAYYSTAAWQDEAPFTAIGLTISARLIPQNKKDPFHELELNPDLRTESITVTFDDIDKAITTLFQANGSGVTCEFYLYYPDENVHVQIWSGQLQAPSVYGWKTVKAVATNGYRSRELVVPGRKHPRECTASIFGGLLAESAEGAEAVRSSLCIYDRVDGGGGTTGNYISGTNAYEDCPKTFDACVDRLGNSGLYFGGFVTDAIATNTGSGYIAASKGNASNLKEPIRVIFGTKHIAALPLLLWRRDGTGNQGWVSTVWEVGEGPISSLSNFKVNDLTIAATGGTFGNGNMQVRLGTRGQARTTYTTDVSNFSSTAIVFADYGRVNPADYNPSNLEASCDVVGFAEVCVYTSAVGPTKTRIWSDDRVWCLLEVYKNQKFGLGYAESKFAIADWITASTWGLQTVSHTVAFPDGESTTSHSRRTTFNAILEGRAVGEQVEDICRSGGLSIPYEHEGDFTITPFRLATAGELSAAKVFYDTGSSVNVCWIGGQPAIELSQIPDTKIVNEVEVRFEEASNRGTERPVTVDDPNQKLRAGRQMGPDYFLSVPKKYSAFGITTLAEALRFAYRMLKFGEFDSGGTDNNLKVTMTVPFEQVLNLQRYDIIKVVSDILDGHSIGSSGLTETPQYFRILSMKKVSGGRCQIIAQAYNHTAYTAFEVDSVVTSISSNPCVVSGAGSSVVDGFYEYIYHLNSKPYYEVGGRVIYWDGTYWQMEVFGVSYYRSASAVAFPWLATWSTFVSGESPVPFVTQGERLNIAIDPVTIDTPTYDTATGILTVVVN